MLFFSLFTSSSLLTRTSRDRWRFPLSLVLYITLYIKPGHPDVTFWLVRSHCEAFASWGLKPTRSEDGSELENKDTLWSCDAELSVIRTVCHRSALVKRLAGGRGLYGSILVESWLEGKRVREKLHQQRVDCRLERIVMKHGVKSWSQADVSASRATSLRSLQERSSNCRFPNLKPLLNNRQCQKFYLG